ncbi:uncharacterized protein LOC130716071 isoform X2 [Lotus japonicus]|uniref:uncharacterized protein LOC130716071 isoform X2 n=1 Tax=Lotus japonicus TaxID=34305 RepID=UPI00258E21E7|nr:uncharacterized protein LOC130716071 isoform X2 [Lotus japonicus]
MRERERERERVSVSSLPLQAASATTVQSNLKSREMNLSPKERNRDWIRALMSSRSGYCDEHFDLRSSEKNIFCVDCAVRVCRHCKEAHSLHRSFQIYKYSYQDVFRHSELQKYFDCENIQTYISNNERIVHLKPRPAIGRPKAVDLCPDSKSKDYNFSTKLKSGGTCEECGKHLPDERNCFCSITCKISALPVDPQNQIQNHLSQSSPVKLEAIDCTMNDAHHSEPESSISEAESFGWVEVMNFRKRPRKTTPQRPIFVFTS